MRIVYLFALNRYEVLENIRVVQLCLHKASLTAKLDRLSDSKPVLRVKGESREETKGTGWFALRSLWSCIHEETKSEAIRAFREAFYT